jgi:hypothetical protein
MTDFLTYMFFLAGRTAVLPVPLCLHLNFEPLPPHPPIYCKSVSYGIFAVCRRHSIWFLGKNNFNHAGGLPSAFPSAAPRRPTHLTPFFFNKKPQGKQKSKKIFNFSLIKK